MTSKCWFVLKQAHYPPPLIPENGRGKVSGSGPICLGHLIPDLKHLDNVINIHGPLDIPRDMPIYPTKAWDLTWEANKSTGVGVAGESGVPIAAAAGITILSNAGAAFKKTIRNFWKFESLDTFIFQPTSEYIEESVEDDEVATYLARRGPLRSSTMFMITGIIVARGAESKTSEVRTQDIYGGLGVGTPPVAEAKTSANVSDETEISATTQKTTDFVWAVRLAKISKGILDRQWSYNTFSSGATFGLEEKANEGKQIADALREEGFEWLKKINVKMEDDIFVICRDSGDN